MKVVRTKVYDTSGDSLSFFELTGDLRNLEKYPDEYIICIACKDECALEMGVTIRKWFEEEWGSQII